jgi:hypothetical protein
MGLPLIAGGQESAPNLQTPEISYRDSLAAQAPSAQGGQAFRATRASAPAVTAAKGINPSSALYHSLAIPGWGQLLNGRRHKALLFAGAETFLLGGFFYEYAQHRSGGHSAPEKDSIKTNQNTFIIYFMLAKVLDIMDAYVDAQFRNYDVKDITPQELILEP